jgi:hypothetical protein
MNSLRLLLVLITLCVSPSLWATTYAYVGPLYTSKTDFTPPCTIGPCANYALDQRISGQFTTAAPLAPNLVGQDVHGSVTSYSFSDGINTYASGNANARFSSFNISTDGVGNIVGSTSDVRFQLWQTGSNPHASGDRLAFLCSGMACGGDSVLNNGRCIIVGQGGNIDPDSCIFATLNASVSLAAAVPSVGTWLIVAQQSSSVPTLSEWSWILLSLLIVGCGVRAMSPW